MPNLYVLFLFSILNINCANSISSPTPPYSNPLLSVSLNFTPHLQWQSHIGAMAQKSNPIKLQNNSDILVWKLSKKEKTPFCWTNSSLHGVPSYISKYNFLGWLIPLLEQNKLFLAKGQYPLTLSVLGLHAGLHTGIGILVKSLYFGTFSPPYS